MTSANIIADSVNPTGQRLTTFELTYPRIVHAEFLTHRMFSRNAASSRAIPNAKLRERVEKTPFVPAEWGLNAKGMQAHEQLDELSAARATAAWRDACDAMLNFSEILGSLGVHKQLANRLLEPFMYITVIASATELENFFALRCHPDAQPEFQELARLMWEAKQSSQPKLLQVGEWHLPLIDAAEAGAYRGLEETLIQISVGRCARVSYLSHDGKRDILEDVKLHNRLLTSGHMSPFEHVAMALPGPYRSGNFVGWHQYRKNLPNENQTFSGPQGQAA